MFGFLFGTACLVGLAVVARGGCGRYAYAGGGHCGPGWRGGHCGHGWRSGHGEERGFGDRRRWMRSPRVMLRWVFERLETSPGQEKVILGAIDQVRAAGEKFHGELANTRTELSRALRGEHFDLGSLRELFGKHDQLIHELRESLVGGLGQVHEALDDRQRRELSDLIEEAGRFGFGRGRWA